MYVCTVYIYIWCVLNCIKMVHFGSIFIVSNPRFRCFDPRFSFAPCMAYTLSPIQMHRLGKKVWVGFNHTMMKPSPKLEKIGPISRRKWRACCQQSIKQVIGMRSRKLFDPHILTVSAFGSIYYVYLEGSDIIQSICHLAQNSAKQLWNLPCSLQAYQVASRDWCQSQPACWASVLPI